MAVYYSKNIWRRPHLVQLHGMRKRNLIIEGNIRSPFLIQYSAYNRALSVGLYCQTLNFQLRILLDYPRNATVHLTYPLLFLT